MTLCAKGERSRLQPGRCTGRVEVFFAAVPLSCLDTASNLLTPHGELKLASLVEGVALIRG